MNLERIQFIYAELEKYQIALHHDPITVGPKYLQDSIATCRNYINAVTGLLMEVLNEKTLVGRELRALKAAYEVDFDNHMANNEQVKRQPNIKDRESLVRTILREQWQSIQAKDGELQDVLMVEKAVRHRHNELRDTMADIRTQKGLIQSEIDTGAMYGDERNARGPAVTTPEEIGDEEIESLLSVGGMSAALAAVPVQPVVKPVVQEVAPASEIQEVKPAKVQADDEVQKLAITSGVEQDEHIESFLNKGSKPSNEDSDLADLEALLG
jgi:hypothetical protein